MCNVRTEPDFVCNYCGYTAFYTTTIWESGLSELETRCPDPTCIWDNSPATAEAARVEQNSPRKPARLACP